MSRHSITCLTSGAYIWNNQKIAIDEEWKKVTKIIFYKSVAVISTGKNNAFLIPTEAMGAQRADILNFIEEMKNR